MKKTPGEAHGACSLGPGYSVPITILKGLQMKLKIQKESRGGVKEF